MLNLTNNFPVLISCFSDEVQTSPENSCCSHSLRVVATGAVQLRLPSLRFNVLFYHMLGEVCIQFPKCKPPARSRGTLPKLNTTYTMTREVPPMLNVGGQAYVLMTWRRIMIPILCVCQRFIHSGAGHIQLFQSLNTIVTLVAAAALYGKIKEARDLFDTCSEIVTVGGFSIIGLSE